VRTLVAVRAFRDEPSLAAGRVIGHRQILVIHAPRARSRLNAALISARLGQRLGEVPLLLSGAADLLGIQAHVVGVGEHLLERQPRLVQRPARASASTYQNEHAEKVPSAPRTPSGSARGLYR
jgi:hypothetical protein